MVTKTKHGYLQDGIFVKHEKEKDRLRMAGGAWSINLKEMPQSTVSVRYVTEDKVYTIDVDKARKNGFIRVFMNEPKLVVPLKHWLIGNKYEEKENTATDSERQSMGDILGVHTQERLF